MDELAEIIWIDEERNAVVVDHRKPTGGISIGGVAGTVGSGSRPVSISNPGRTQPTVVRYPVTSTRQPIVVSSAPKTVLGGLGLGALLDMGAQLLASLLPLPAAPVSTGDVAKDVANLTMYQTALATHAKSDERIRTIGSLVNRVVS